MSYYEEVGELDEELASELDEEVDDYGDDAYEEEEEYGDEDFVDEFADEAPSAEVVVYYCPQRQAPSASAQRRRQR